VEGSELLKGEPARHRRVPQPLHLDGVWRPTTLELGDYQLTLTVQAEDVQSVALFGAAETDPLAELEGDDADIGAEDLRMGDHPLLEMTAFPQAGLLKAHRLSR
jgi:hypothetical protein